MPLSNPANITQRKGSRFPKLLRCHVRDPPQHQGTSLHFHSEPKYLNAGFHFSCELSTVYIIVQGNHSKIERPSLLLAAPLRCNS